MLSINFTDAQGKVKKTYTVVSLKMGLVEKLMDIQEQQARISEGTQTAADQKALWANMGALLVEVFGRQFTYDELKENVDIKEMVRCFNDMAAFITESVSKN